MTTSDAGDYAQRFPLTLLTVLPPEDRSNYYLDEFLGRGVRCPSGLIVLDWNLDAYPAEDRLDKPHQSFYWTLGDLERVTGGEVVVEREV